MSVYEQAGHEDKTTLIITSLIKKMYLSEKESCKESRTVARLLKSVNKILRLKKP